MLIAAGVDVTLVGNSAKAPYLGLEITPAALNLTQATQTKTYGQTLAPVGSGAQASGVINGVTVDGVTINDVLDSFTMTSAGFAPTANIGTYAIAPGSLSFSAGSAANYAVSASSANVTVNRASLVVIRFLFGAGEAGAARRWITAELTACSKAAGGRLQVEEQSFIEPAGNRVSQPTELVNVVATLPGRGASKSRMLVVSGHYDSRNSDVMDSLGEAPGANDDASGTAAVMELACVMARRQFDATLVFMAVPGEDERDFRPQPAYQHAPARVQRTRAKNSGK